MIFLLLSLSVNAFLLYYNNLTIDEKIVLKRNIIKNKNLIKNYSLSKFVQFCLILDIDLTEHLDKYEILKNKFYNEKILEKLNLESCDYDTASWTNDTYLFEYLLEHNVPFNYIHVNLCEESIFTPIVQKYNIPHSFWKMPHNNNKVCNHRLYLSLPDEDRYHNHY